MADGLNQNKMAVSSYVSYNLNSAHGYLCLGSLKSVKERLNILPTFMGGP